MKFADALAPAVDLVFPPRCPLCGDGLSAQAGLCAACWGALVIPGEPWCALCQRPFGESGENFDRGAICAPCLGQPPRHDGVAAGALYNDASRRLVLAFKHGGRISLAPFMARLMAARLTAVQAALGAEDEDWLVVPTPLHRWRLWRRGFNQAALLAREIARLKGAQLEVDMLERRKRTPPLGGLNRAARARALAGAITVRASRADRLRGANVVLVDDVLTSGATSQACVSALKRGGAKRVTICCFARVLNELTGPPTELGR